MSDVKTSSCVSSLPMVTIVAFQSIRYLKCSFFRISVSLTLKYRLWMQPVCQTVPWYDIQEDMRKASPNFWHLGFPHIWAQCREAESLFCLQTQNLILVQVQWGWLSNTITLLIHIWKCVIQESKWPARFWLHQTRCEHIPLQCVHTLVPNFLSEHFCVFLEWINDVSQVRVLVSGAERHCSWASGPGQCQWNSQLSLSSTGWQ